MNKQTHIVQVGGLHFRFDRLRARRGFRGLASLVDLLGAGAAAMVSGGQANGVSAAVLTEAGGLSAVSRLVIKAAIIRSKREEAAGVCVLAEHRA